jgi:hypothetical protein
MVKRRGALHSLRKWRISANARIGTALVITHAQREQGVINMFDFSKFQTAALAVLGAIVFTSVSVGAAVGPARQLEVQPVQVAAASQTGQLA